MPKRELTNNERRGAAFAESLLDKLHVDQSVVYVDSRTSFGPCVTCDSCEESVPLDESEKEISSFINDHKKCNGENLIGESIKTLIEAIRSKDYHRANTLFMREMKERASARVQAIKTRVMMEDAKTCELCGSKKNLTVLDDGTAICKDCDIEECTKDITEDTKKCELCGTTKNLNILDDGTAICKKCDVEEDD